MARLARTTLARSALEVAPALLGAVLARREDDGGLTRAMIVETEAYEPDDPASHAYRGRTPRNASMFGQAGTLYVYLVYGIHHCANVATGRVDEGAAVLLRAAEPVDGLDRMRRRRPGSSDRDLCRGPGRLAQAFHVTWAFDGLDLVTSDTIWLERGDRVTQVTASPRVGVRHAADQAWRFSIEGSPFVSGPRARLR